MLRKLFTFLLGLIIGIIAVSLAATIYYKHKRTGDRYSRYDAVPPAGSEVAGGARVYAASSLDRIFQDGKTLLPPSFGNEVKILAAGNEYEAFQIVVFAGEKTLTNVTLEIAPFSPASPQSPGPHDPSREPANSATRQQATSSSSPISLPSSPIIQYYAVGFVPTVTPYYPTKFVGPWPDPLFPQVRSAGLNSASPRSLAGSVSPSSLAGSVSPSSLADQPQGIDVESGMTQPFWISLYVPRGAEKGEWRGEVVVKSGDKVLKKIPILLTCWPFDLLTSSTLKTAFDFYGHITHKRYPQKANETNENYQFRIDAINQKFLQAMLRYRMCPILNVDPTNDKELATVDRLRILGLNNFSVGRKGGTFNNNWPQGDKDIEALLPLYRTYGEMLKLNGLLQNNYIYTWDEGNIGNPVVAKVASMIHRAYPGLKNMVCYHGFWDPDEHPGWGQDIDIWCFQVDNFVESKMRALQKLGIEMWMYISGPSGYDSPNLAIDFDSIGYRAVPWLCWKYDIRGFLYWCVNWWEKTDPFISAANTKWEQNGNGLLFYPGPDGPWPSLRAEIWRDGMEDYEYIQILLKRLVEIKKRRLDETHREFYEQAKALLMVDDSIAKNMFNYNKDASALLKRRADIAEKIVEAGKILSKSQIPSIK